MADGHVSVARFVSSNANSRFAYYWLASQPFKEYVYAALVVGATNQIELNRERLAEAPVPLPPIDEQRRIADFLDAETTRIDSLDRMRSRQLSLLDELVASHIDSAFEREIKERTVRLGYLARVQTGITVDAKRRTELDDVTRPYLRVANVQAGYLDLTEVTEITVPRRMALSAALRYGDVLMTEGGDLDKLGRGTVWEGQIEGCVHQNHVFAVRVDDRVLDPYYLALMTRTTAARRYFESTGSKTTNLASTSSSKIRDFCVPVPALDQQRRTVLALRDVLADMEKLAQQIKRQRQLLAERRTALITAAVTGQFDVTTARGGDLS